MTTPSTFDEAALAVLTCFDAREKAETSRRMAKLWQEGALALTFHTPPPKRPGRPGKPELLPPTQMPKRGRGGNLANRLALLHALAHIELNAIDLAWDIALRFGERLPQAFIDDWVSVGDDEARHFLMLDDRLRVLDSFYGALPAHDGLWQAAEETADNLLARLAIVPMVLEARGLDVTPATVSRLRAAGDEKSADILNIIYEDEIGHVAKGVHWFMAQCEGAGINAESAFKSCVRTHFRGILKPPFNDNARAKAGFPAHFYANS